MNLKDFPGVVLAMVIAGAFFVSAFLIIEGMLDSSTACPGAFYNTTEAYCQVSATNTTAGAQTDIVLSSRNVTSGLDNITEQLPTVGTLIGVAVILAVVIGGFMVGRRFT